MGVVFRDQGDMWYGCIMDVKDLVVFRDTNLGMDCHQMMMMMMGMCIGCRGI